MSKNCLQEIKNSILAGYPFIYLITWEERRACSDIVAIASKLGTPVYTWTLTSGLLKPDGQKLKGTEKLVDSVQALSEISGKAIFIFKDLYRNLAQPEVIRSLRDLSEHLKESGQAIIIPAPALELPVELEEEFQTIDYDLPTEDELAGAILSFLNSIGQAAGISMEPEEISRYAQAAKGLTIAELNHILAKSLVDEGKISLGAVQRQKEQAVRKSGVLEYFDSEADLTDIGGLGELKRWLKQRSKAFTTEAKKFGLPAPKGVLLVGVQGCGKSLSAKAVANFWKMPLLKLDVGKVYDSYIGASEKNMRQVIKVCESVAPVALWLDEIEKGFSGILNSSQSDSGTSARVFSSFLSWLQEKSAPVFVVATANDITQLPPELVRKGRFDEIFFIDLPGFEEWREIWFVHLQKANRDPERFDLDRLARESEGMSGAEIEQVLASTLYRAFDLGCADINTDLISEELEVAVPLSRTMREQIILLRSWAQTRARQAS